MSCPKSVSGVVLLKSDGRTALLQHRDDKPGLSHAGKWVFPGGHCESCESAEECARREFLEETAYRIGKMYRLSSFIDNHVAEIAPYRLDMFWALYDGEQTVHCREGQGMEFIKREDAPDVPDYLLDVWDAAIAAFRENSSQTAL